MKKIMSMIVCGIAILGGAFLPHFAQAAGEDNAAGERVAAIHKAYKSIQDIKGSFVQKSTIKDLKKTEIYKGQFFIKAKKMRWDYKGEKPQTVYITGGEIIIYQPQQKQAFKAPFNHETYGQAPIALLSGLGNINREFFVAMQDEKLILTPKAPMGNVTQVELTTNDAAFPITSLSVIDKLGNRVDITLTDVRTNTNIRNAVFIFKAPEGVAVLEQ
ncbi:MAG TPA: outer membrane lipoprotein carrier protein LolA [Dissulfurispiraceae bacterium]|nr:outer membrane lipoprotein carrier protein LolA [Dissulfurispiraceae bacterium]